MGLNYLLSIFYFKMRMGEHSTDVTFVIFWCHIRTCNDGCNINEQMKVDLVSVHSVIDITALFPEYFNKNDIFCSPSVDL